MRLYFDECCSRRLGVELKQFFSADYPEIEIAHVLDFYDQGTGDSSWLTPLQEDRSWIVVTQDLGKDPKKKLPLVCRELGLTHIAYTKAIIHSGYSVQKIAMVAAWSQIKHIHSLPRGTQVRLGLTTLKGGIERYELQIKNGGAWRRFEPSPQ